MRERLTWDEICDAYPNQWVKLIDVILNSNNSTTIESAVVDKVGRPEDQDIIDALQDKCYLLYTTPEAHTSVGMAFV